MPGLGEAWRLWLLLGLEDFRPALPLFEQMGDAGIRRAAELYYTIAAEMHGPRPTQETYMLGWGRRAALAQALLLFLEETPLVLLPISAEPPFTYGDDVTSVERARALISAQWPMFAPATVCFPGIAVPTGIVDGLPTGVQILASRFREDLLLDAGDVIEARAARSPRSIRAPEPRTKTGCVLPAQLVLSIRPGQGKNSPCPFLVRGLGGSAGKREGVRRERWPDRFEYGHGSEHNRGSERTVLWTQLGRRFGEPDGKPGHRDHQETSGDSLAHSLLRRNGDCG